MSRATLTSINKPHTDNIFTDDKSRKKTVEWRTKPLPKGLHYVYETKNKGGCGKVIGEMTIVENIKYPDVSAIPHEMILKGRFGTRQLDIYSNGRPLYANVIVNAKRYDKPKELGEFWAYNSELEKRYDEQDGYCCYDGTNEHGEPLTDCGSACDNIANCYRCWEEWSGWCHKVKRPPQSYCFVESL